MTETPCGDITCHCCYPDLTCWCTDKPSDAEPGTRYACPDCGRVFVAESFSDSASFGIVGSALRAHGLSEPTVAWLEVEPPTWLKD